MTARPPRLRLYDEAVREGLIVLWEAADRICGKRLKAFDETSPLLVRPAPICLPSLAGRAYELSRVIDEYIRDAVIELNAQDTGVTDADRAWIRERAASSLAEIEKAALRMVAIRASRSVSAAAERIGMAPVSLLNWLGRRRRHGRRR